MTTEILPRPEQIEPNLSMWVNEQIWGHRLHDEQNPWLCFLEFLNVLQSELQNNRPFIETKYNSLTYSTNTRFYLRNILFNNPHLEAILAEFPDEESRWNRWLGLITQKSGGIAEPDFSYLRNRFATFRDFAHVIKFLRSTALEGDSNKRWSSKFVFPYGPESLYEDLDVTAAGGFTNDRRFFARGGELLYLMICRTPHSAEVLTLLSSIGVIGTADSVPSTAQKWNKLIAHLQPETQKQRDSGRPPFLPYKTAVDFNNLAQDWINIGKCKMPGYDALPHLVAIMGLHLTIYFLRRARIVLGLPEQPEFVLEILAPKKTVIRDLASDSFLHNNNLSQSAIAEHIERITSLPEWQACIQAEDPMLTAAQILRTQFAWPSEKKEDELANASTPEILLQRLRDNALSRHKKHPFKFHGNWAREIGLSSSRGSRRTRYVPTDALLKTIVFATVPTRMEFQQFLLSLNQKYGFVIGDKQAFNIIDKGDADREAFRDNAARLEERLASIGLLKRLSDACAYVQNPYSLEQK